MNSRTASRVRKFHRACRQLFGTASCAASDFRPAHRFLFAETLEPRRLLSTAAISSGDAIPFTQDVIAENPGNNPVVKFLVDIDNNGKEDAVVGHETNEGGGGIDLYRFPTSGNPNDTWTESVIDPTADVYESMRSADVSGNTDSSGKPVNDLIVNERGTIYWYENPLGLGEDPYTATWQKFEIGTAPQGATHEMYLSTSLAGNGKLCVVDNTVIFVENSPTSWTEVDPAAYNRTEKGLYLFNGGGLGDIDLLGTGNAPNFQVGWYENPLDHGGNPLTDTWTFHPIGPAYGGYQAGDGVSYAAMDVTGNGQEDIITCDGENGENPPYLTGGLIWWQRPSNIYTGTWIPHTIDSTITDVHNLVLADLQNNGQTEILAFEQDQSPQGRLLIIYNEGGTGQNWLEQTLASDSDPAEGGGEGGHNESVGDATGDGYDDILTSPHGFYTFVNPISLYLNDLPTDGITEPTVTSSPASVSTKLGKSVTFSVAATGTGTLTYQWQENGLDIAGANSPSYTFTAHTPDNGAAFRCIVGNPAGMIPSASAALSLNTAGGLEVLNPAHSNPSTVKGTQTHLIASADGPTGAAGVTYAWSVLHVPSGAATPKFSRNKSNSAASTVVTFYKDGTYIFRCTMSDGSASPVVSDVEVPVVQTAAGLRVSPHKAMIQKLGSVAYSAVAYDQFGHTMRTSDAPVFSVGSGPGSINASSGVYTASDNTGGVLIDIDDDGLSAAVGATVV